LLAGIVGERIDGRFQRLERILDIGADGSVDTQALRAFSIEELRRLLELVEPDQEYTAEELQEMLR